MTMESHSLLEGRERAVAPFTPMPTRYIALREWPSRRGNKTHRLSVGPFNTRREAEQAIRVAKRSGIAYAESTFRVVAIREPISRGA
jgi:hypothetical protein